MNLFRLGEGLPSRFWLRLGLGAFGLALLAWVAQRVDWRQFRTVLMALDWTWLMASLSLGLAALAARTLRLAWILDRAPRFGGVWRAVAMGNLGKALLPMGGGEVIKIGALRALVDVPAVTAAAGTFLDRIFDLLGVTLLCILLAGTGAALRLRAGPLLLGGAALVLLAALTAGAFQFRASAMRLGSTRLAGVLQHVAEVLATLKRPSHLGRLLAIQAVITAADLLAIYTGLLAFAFGPALPFMIAVKLSIYLMLGAALPLLPGGAGTLQVACLLALQPAGVSAAGAFAYSIVAQAVAFALAGTLGVGAALWPGTKQT